MREIVATGAAPIQVPNTSRRRTNWTPLTPARLVMRPTCPSTLHRRVRHVDCRTLRCSWLADELHYRPQGCGPLHEQAWQGHGHGRRPTARRDGRREVAGSSQSHARWVTRGSGGMKLAGRQLQPARRGVPLRGLHDSDRDGRAEDRVAVRARASLLQVVHRQTVASQHVLDRCISGIVKAGQPEPASTTKVQNSANCSSAVRVADAAHR
ncbi:MAG: hypothetical protein ACI9S9_003144 [Planctomycetota bacterium]|jgi:hypothetical protein